MYCRTVLCVYRLQFSILSSLYHSFTLYNLLNTIKYHVDAERVTDRDTKYARHQDARVAIEPRPRVRCVTVSMMCVECLLCIRV